jgi:hypothetical protein
MKKASPRVPPETSMSRYDWSRAQRGRHLERALRSIASVTLDRGLYAHFGSPEAVIEALELVVKLRAVGPTGKPRRKKSAA